MADSEQVQTRLPSVLEDPSARAVARSYAAAFLAAAQTVGVDTALEEFHSFVDDVLQANPGFADLLCSEFVGIDDKVGMIDRVFGPAGSEFFVNFLRVLARHQRLDLLPLILDESQLRHEENTGRGRVQITSAVPLSDEQRQGIFERLNAKLPFEPILEASVDPALLGGLVIRIGDTVYDTSLRTRMRQLRDRLRERNVHEIQSGRDRFSHPEGD